MNETESGNPDCPHEAVEGHREDEVEGPPARGRQGRSDLYCAQRNEFAEVKPGERTQSEVVSDDEDDGPCLNRPTVFLQIFYSLKVNTD